MRFPIRIFATIAIAAATTATAMAVSPLLQPAADKQVTPLKISLATSHLLAGLGNGITPIQANNNALIAGINLWKPEIPEIHPVEEAEETIPEYIDDMLGHASTFIGTRYRRGGKAPGGFDCSGFTSYVFRQFGVALNPTSRSQYTQGTQIETENLQPGDLVFFSGRAVSRKRVGHVGIVTEICPDGSFRFIHSSCSLGVTISHSQEKYYSRRYIGARRVE
ncbi:C40 family peptidase [uncultured Muribaculum sp.]|uniref:C40 family peptidase n=1 Tax=uncultured Muribaculum sp. TaxID=1918613 RepID=UPI0025B0D98D|nr:C40 family peptidase [uncultured Muribaculum sp.]